MTPEELLRLADEGESATVEFKETTGQRSEAAKTLSAMLNGTGGSVLFGVRANSAVVGQQVSERTMEDVTQVCRETIHPAYPPNIERIPVPGRDGREVLVASVPAGNMKPYSYHGRSYIRSGPATVDMPDELQLALVLERAHGFDRWELNGSDRTIEVIDHDEVAAFRDDAIANNRARFDAAAETETVLQALNLLTDDGHPNRAALVLFGSPGAFGGEFSMCGCHLVAVDGVDLGESIRDERLIEANAFATLRQAVAFCRDHLDQPVRLEETQATTGWEIPQLVIREALANAIAHRDYATPGHIQVRVFRDRLDVLSPGSLHFGLTTADLYSPHGSHPWNPLVVAALYRRGVVDQLGSGTLRMVRLCAADGLGRPLFSSTPASVTCALPRQGYWLRADTASTKVDAGEAAALRLLAESPLARRDLSDRLQLSETDATALLGRLREHGLVHPNGHGRGAAWALGPTPE